MKHLILVLIAISSQVFAVNEAKIKRYALLVAREDGGLGKPKLRYSKDDVQSLAHVLKEIGGVSGSEMSVAYNPTKSDLLQRFQYMRQVIKRKTAPKERSELVFYYSGHSDESGILLGSEKIAYADLKKSIQDMKADVSMLILDSCASGSLTRLKGGMKVAPFLTESLSNLKGFVALTSSSNDEVSQESDKLGASYFTHYLISGLRGAADISGDNRVTLNEAYHYAYNQTLARTEKTLVGAQHPSYTIQLSGQGELVMTDIRKVSAKLLLDSSIEGRLFIRDKNEKIVAEVAKPNDKMMVLGLEPGMYSLLLVQTGLLKSAKVIVAENKIQGVAINDFRQINGETAEQKGSIAATEDKNKKLVKVPAEFSVIPGVSTNQNPPDSTENTFHFSLIYMKPARLTAFGWSLLGASDVGQSTSGVQFSLWFNRVPELSGAQLGAVNMTTVSGEGLQIGAVNFAKLLSFGGQIGAINMNLAEESAGTQVGGVNYSEDIDGAQAGGANVARRVNGAQIGGVNYTRKVSGIQLGGINVAEEVNGTQIGVVNYGATRDSFTLGVLNLVKDGMLRISYHFDDLVNHQFGFKYGTKYSYSFLELGIRLSQRVEHSEAFGLGFETPKVKILSLGLEALCARSDAGTFNSDGIYFFEGRLFPRVAVTQWLDVFAGLSVKQHLTPADEWGRSSKSSPWGERTRIGYVAGAELKF